MNLHVCIFLCACVDVYICMWKPKVHVGCPPQLFSAFFIFILFITCECICVGMCVPWNTCYSEHEEVRGPSVEISSLCVPHGSQARTRVTEHSSRHTYALGLLANPSLFASYLHLAVVPSLLSAPHGSNCGYQLNPEMGCQGVQQV